ncbi:hypothetical protein M3Y94_00517600 [Aphelenchoides besseyi]|nr:hypothetical protein M3Y94_00517600 [Aphelenchoides besseyi]KAI6225991.1 hypothetical protein M3Y95_00755200 [Aphelenchoides besseyi]
MSYPGDFVRNYKIPRHKHQDNESRDINTPSTSSPLAKSLGVAKKPESPKTSVQARAVALEKRRLAEEKRKAAKSHVQRPQDLKMRQQTLGKRKNPNVGATTNKQKVRTKETSRDPIELLDRIWREMDEDNRRKKTEEETQVTPSPTGSPSAPHNNSTPTSANCLRLTRHELMTAPRDDSLIRRFLTKPGLMERILGYKMLNSRVDPFEIMRLPAKLNECQLPDGADVDYGVKFVDVIQPPASTSKVQLPTSAPIRVDARRGPRTPEGSPNQDPDDTALSTDEWPTHSPNQSKLMEPTKSPIHSNAKEERLSSSRAEILQTVSHATNTPIDQVEKIIGEDLQNAIGRVDRSVLLGSLKDAIRNVTEAPNATNSPALTGACDMEDSSTDSNASASGHNSPLLPPPPPPPIDSPVDQMHRTATTQPAISYESPRPVLQYPRWEPPSYITEPNSFNVSVPSSIHQPANVMIPQYGTPPFARIPAPIAPPPSRPVIDISRPPPIHRTPDYYQAPLPQPTPYNHTYFQRFNGPPTIRGPYQHPPVPYNQPVQHPHPSAFSRPIPQPEQTVFKTLINALQIQPPNHYR